MQPGGQVEQDLPAGYNGFVVVLEGGGVICSSSVRVGASHVAWITPSKESSVVSFTDSEHGMRAILFAGLPLHEPVAARGFFVMNTDEELAVGFAEFRGQ